MFKIAPLIRRTTLLHCTLNVGTLYRKYVQKVIKDLPDRTLMYTPGDSERKLSKNCSADVLILDMEDGVSPNRRELAREMILDHLSKGKIQAKGKTILRINPISTREGANDLTEIINHQGSNGTFSGLLLPKVNEVKDVEIVTQMLEKKKLHNIQLYLTIETAQGIVNLKDIVSASRWAPISGLVFGAEDYCADVGVKRTKSCQELLYTRSKIVTYARAFNLQCIDLVSIEFRDKKRLTEECLQGWNLGFTGKQVIHPNQIEVVNKIFGPTEKEIKQAKEIVLQYFSNVNGSIDYHGVSIDTPMIKSSLRVLVQANIDIEKLQK
ncbi:putative lyase beta subunit [Anaeramoeba flamelloides]|uniref:Lyase beta subunit n=1 Tax=Anaeramoeba flamelloides TaxID=1746091 RepID=A0AAV7ZN76_9EUKA|nr:putative lyase beta subunit [Anaeramoeba flamelloides]